MDTAKFNEDDRRQVILKIEEITGKKLTPIGSRRKYLEDQEGGRYCVLGGSGTWHGLSRDILDTDSTIVSKTTLVVACMSSTKIEVYMGPISPLAKAKKRLTVPSPPGKEYNFNIDDRRGDKIRIKEVPDYALARLIHKSYSQR